MVWYKDICEQLEAEGLVLLSQTLARSAAFESLKNPVSYTNEA